MRRGSGVSLVMAVMFCLLIRPAQARPTPKCACNGMHEAADAVKGQHFDEARTLLEPLARQGCASGEYNLGIFYENGLGGLAKNGAQAESLWRRAASKGSPPACWKLFNVLRLRAKTEADGKELLEFLTCAAELGHQEAQSGLATWYEEGAPLIPKDNAAAWHFYHLATLKPSTMSEIVFGSITDNPIAAAERDMFVERVPEDERATLAEKARPRLLSFDPADTAASPGRAIGSRSDAVLRLAHVWLTRQLVEQGAVCLAGDFGRRGDDTIYDVHARLEKSLPPIARAVLIQRKDTRPRTGSIMVSASQLFEIVRPGDGVGLFDGRTAHYSMVFSRDVAKGTVTFVDRWPDRMMLLPNQNTLGIVGKLVPYHWGKHLVKIGRHDLGKVAFAIVAVRDKAAADSGEESARAP
jgi:hypothetical protein